MNSQNVYMYALNFRPRHRIGYVFFVLIFIRICVKQNQKRNKLKRGLSRRQLTI